MQIEIQSLTGRTRIVDVSTMHSAVFYRWAARAEIGQSTQRFYSAGMRKVTRVA